MFPADSSRIERSLFIIALIFIIIVAVKMTAYIVTLFAMALILTLMFLPALYAIWFKIKPVAKGEHAAPKVRTEPVPA